MQQIEAAYLDKHLNNRLEACYLVHGDPLLVLESAQQIRSAAYKQGFSERVLVNQSSSSRSIDWEHLLSKSAPSLFDQKKVIEFRCLKANFLKQDQAHLIEFVQSLSAGQCLVISFSELDWDIKKKPWFQTLLSCVTEVIGKAPRYDQLPNWIGLRLKQQEQKTDLKTLQFMADRVEGNLLAADQEIKKLGIMYQIGFLTYEEVEKTVLNHAKLGVKDFQLALNQENKERSFRILEALRISEAPLPLVVWSMSSAARKKGLRPLLWRLAQVDKMAKGFLVGDAWLELFQVLHRFFQVSRRKSF